MVGGLEDFAAPQGKRARMGQFCHRSGLLRPLQTLRARLRQDLRILAYHRVLDIANPERFDFDLELVSASVDGFCQQMELIKKRFHPLPLKEAAAALESGQGLPRDAVVVTFDDGYDDNYRHAFPVLRKLDIPATFFVSTGHIDNGLPFSFDWFVHMLLCTHARELSLPEVNLVRPIPQDRSGRLQLAWQALKRLKLLDDEVVTDAFTRLQHAWRMPVTPHPDCRPMSWEQVREMHAAGFEVGSHGRLHRVLARLSRPALEAELRKSWEAIERELGTPPSSIAYPVGGYGAFDSRVIEATRQAGYQFACTYIRGTNAARDTDPYKLRRLPVERYMDPGWFATMLSLPGLMSFPPTHPAPWEAS